MATPVFPIAAPRESGSICKKGTAVMVPDLNGMDRPSKNKLIENVKKRAENKDFFIVYIILTTFDLGI